MDSSIQKKILIQECIKQNEQDQKRKVKISFMISKKLTKNKPIILIFQKKRNLNK